MNENDHKQNQERTLLQNRNESASVPSSLDQHFSKYKNNTNNNSASSRQSISSRSNNNSQEGATSTHSLATDTNVIHPIKSSSSAPGLASDPTSNLGNINGSTSRLASGSRSGSNPPTPNDKMRRRNARDPRLYYGNENNTTNTDSYGYFDAHSISPVRNRKGRATEYHESEDESSYARAHPTITEFMPADQQYPSYLRSNRNINSTPTHVHHAQNTDPDSFFSQPANLQCSKFTTFFSLIASFLLFIFGLLIEVQPLYIKGISPRRTPMTRNLHGQYSTYSFVHFSARLRILQNATISHSRSNKEEMSRMLESMTFEMKSEAKVAFKASALYFLIMVLSYIYTQNHVMFHASVQKMNLGMKVRNAVYSVPRNLILWIRKYRRRNYHNVQEAFPHSKMHSEGYAPGIGLAKVQIPQKMNANSMNMSSTVASGSIPDYDSSSGQEDYDVGLSMRERSLTRTQKNSTGVGGNNATASSGMASAWDAIVDKTKKG